MSLYIDDRVGSRDLAPLLLKRGLPVEVTRLEYGDLTWLGNGPDGLWPVGVEVKTLGDLLSCIANGRFAGHQLGGLKDCYQVVYLLVEGQWKPGEQGELLSWKGSWREVPWGKRKWLYRNVSHWLATMREKGGVTVLRTANRAETVQALHDEYTWWTADEWEEHRSHLQFDRSRSPSLVRPSGAMRMAAEVPGIGWRRAAAVARHFKTPRRMANASVEEWQEVEGVGKTLAEKAVRFMAGGGSAA